MADEANEDISTADIGSLFIGKSGPGRTTVPDSDVFAMTVMRPEAALTYLPRHDHPDDGRQGLGAWRAWAEPGDFAQSGALPSDDGPTTVLGAPAVAPAPTSAPPSTMPPTR